MWIHIHPPLTLKKQSSTTLDHIMIFYGLLQSHEQKPNLQKTCLKSFGVTDEKW